MNGSVAALGVDVDVAVPGRALNVRVRVGRGRDAHNNLWLHVVRLVPVQIFYEDFNQRDKRARKTNLVKL